MVVGTSYGPACWDNARGEQPPSRVTARSGGCQTLPEAETAEGT
ncbi:MAG: hypothetical protein M5U29_03135 [Anaerolineae bacterium]|nr:hypothetical protein [Anaerolineae bacterium]